MPQDFQTLGRMEVEGIVADKTWLPNKEFLEF
ncbi:hypothetical protein A2U01_0116973, partial [Trifolium medium]|nr:hypothetical protein [Trifolium medium]